MHNTVIFPIVWFFFKLNLKIKLYNHKYSCVVHDGTLFKYSY